MSILSYNEIKPKKIVMVEGDPYLVLDSHVFRKQMRKPVNQTKLKNIKTGKIMERSFHAAEVAEEVELGKKKATYLFNKPNRQQGITEYWFCESGNPAARFLIPETLLGINPGFLKQNTDVDMLMFGEEIIGITLPIKLQFKVTEAPPSIKGDTAQGGAKQITIETGATLNVPLFVEEGETILVNTETGEYAGRAEQ